MIAAGVLSGLVAALFGFLDWLAIPSATRAKRIGVVHGGTNFLMLLLYAMSWAQRGANPIEPRPSRTCSRSPGVRWRCLAGSSWIGWASVWTRARTSTRRAR